MSDTIHEREVVAMPALALRAITVFPHLLLHFDVGREFSIRALEQAMYHKPAGHHFSTQTQAGDEKHNMNQIGG